MAGKKKVPPKPQKKQPEETVWMACRASRPCGGQTARVVYRKKLPGGGTEGRYRCTQCGGSFHIHT